MNNDQSKNSDPQTREDDSQDWSLLFSGLAA
ncbi:hypothetical protein F7D09_1278 [Bifidobacterium leontopitheci]|uniref:Uncharacterized protein n=1 Tax=Bifidobacterium leontopitheci TaxID=2650774 RepID=A0A6I1GKP2_9BIFI|nr:hypothetical protein F7D09_1278 [Bifidobacterium leontopitheci]